MIFLCAATDITSLLALQALLVALLVALAAGAPSTRDSPSPFTLQDFIDGRFVTRTFKGTWVAGECTDWIVIIVVIPGYDDEVMA